jgi:hypothetical protein
MSEFDADEFQKKLKKKVAKKTKKMGNVQINGGKSSAFYFMGFVGAAIYFVSRANGFWDGTLGFLKALVWPVFLVYQAFVSLLG